MKQKEWIFIVRLIIVAWILVSALFKLDGHDVSWLFVFAPIWIWFILFFLLFALSKFFKWILKRIDGRHPDNEPI